MPVRYLPKAIASAIIGVMLFMSFMPNSIKGMPALVFYLAFATSLVVGWLAATGIFKVVLWFLHRR
jgi:hypothetical protein